MKILSYLILVALAYGKEPSGSSFPSASPSRKPSGSSFPSAIPSSKPSGSTFPSASPSGKPSGSFIPSAMPSSKPSGSTFPSAPPSGKPSGSSSPSAVPSGTPSSPSLPSAEPSDIPSLAGSSAESLSSLSPQTWDFIGSIVQPTLQPVFDFSTFPSAPPSGKPSGSSSPSAVPSGTPSSPSSPSAEPSDIPSLAGSSAESLASLSPQTWDFIGSIVQPTPQPVFDFSAIVPFALTSSPTVSGVGASLPVTGTGGPVAVSPVAIASGSPVAPSASSGTDSGYFAGGEDMQPREPKAEKGNGKGRTKKGQGKKGVGARTRLGARTYGGRE
ncbi:hypothetical protein MHU86_1604 [Fragilaria crotonensis]|nr:hypothetical protein MHU86_1604 [Fragilaria crotonensis]